MFAHPARLFIILFSGISVVCLPAQKDFQQLDSLLTQLHQTTQLNGVVLIANNGVIQYQKAFGQQDVSGEVPLSLDASFNLASITKQFVGMLMMIAKEEGKLRYDDPVAGILPELPYSGLSFRHLATHTSGLPEYFDLAVNEMGPLDTLDNEGLLHLLARMQPPLDFLPGEQWSYSNTGYLMLALALERLYQRPLHLLFKEKIVQPLDLSNTFGYQLLLKEAPPAHVKGIRRESGKWAPEDLTPLDGVIGDGNFYASALDLLRWEQSLYESKLVSAETLAEAFQPVRLNDGTTYPYGFGWFLDPEAGIVSHTGVWVGFTNIIVRDLKNKATLIVLTNGSDGSAIRLVPAWYQGKSLPAIPLTHLIQNVRLIDGAGNPVRTVDVRLKGDRIWETGALEPFPGEAVTEGRGKVLTPGFIDTHSHHFGNMEQHRDMKAAVSQGITSIVIGQDGYGDLVDTIQKRLNDAAVAVNVAPYTGHTSLRLRVMGPTGWFRPASRAEIDSMDRLLAQDLARGPWGLSPGLEYERAFLSNRAEVLRLAHTTAKAGGRYMSHIRSEDIHLMEALDEILQIGRETHMPVQISHFKIALREHWGKAPQLLAQLQKARAEGIDITADCYPYDYWHSTIRVLFPKRDYDNPASAVFACENLFDPEGSVMLRFAPEPAYAGKTVADIARLRQEAPAQTLLYLVAAAEAFENAHPDADGVEAIMGKSMSPQDVGTLLAWPHTNICSDGGHGGHPRGSGAFTRVLKKYVREEQWFTLVEAIRKMTGLAAEHLGWTDRGLIAPGYYADLVLLDPETVGDRASIDDSTALSDGILMVWVNGVPVYRSGATTGTYPGRLLLRKGL